MSRAIKMLLGAMLLLGAGLVGFYGVVVIAYHDGGGDTYVKFNGDDVDGDLVGGIALSIAAVAAILAIVLLRSGWRSARSTSFVEPS